MAEGARPANRTGRTVLWFALAFIVLVAANATQLGDHIHNALVRATEDIDTRNAIHRLFGLVWGFTAVSSVVTFATSAAAASIGAVTRMLLRARVRAGFADPLARVRAFVAARPRLTGLLVGAPAVLWTAWLARTFAHFSFVEDWDMILAGLGFPAAVTIVVQIALARRGLRALVAPTVSEDEASNVSADGLTFTAVAVTTETIGAVGGLAALSVVMVGLAYALPPTLARNPAFAAALVGYLALATGGTMLFRRASRISVGLDGIHVSGSARERFIPFREIDGARERSNTIELFRGERVVLRLQLHGEDAMRRSALTARINAAIALAETQRDEPAVSFVASASTDALDRAAGGVSSYREAAPTREKLWQVLESPAVDAAGRKAAATALARGGTEAERTRLRVAADQCAEPSVRARLEELLDDEDEAEPAAALKVRRA